MGAELGATPTLFPSDEMTRKFLRAQNREADWKPLAADPDATYEEAIEIDLSKLDPLVVKPHSPDNVVPVRELAQENIEVKQVAVGSSVNSSYRDLKMVAEMMRGRKVAPHLHMTFSPGSRQILINLEKSGAMLDMALAGVRGLEVACGPCIGMGPRHPHAARASAPSTGIFRAARVRPPMRSISARQRLPLRPPSLANLPTRARSATRPKSPSRTNTSSTPMASFTPLRTTLRLRCTLAQTSSLCRSRHRSPIGSRARC